MRNRCTAWAIAVVAATGGLVWGQGPRPAQTVETAVTPKIVLPAKAAPQPQAPKPGLLPSGVVAAAETNQPISARAASPSREGSKSGIVLTGATEPAVQGTTASKFVPAVRPPVPTTPIRRVNSSEPDKGGPVQLPPSMPTNPGTGPRITLDDPDPSGSPGALPAPMEPAPQMSAVPGRGCGGCCSGTCAKCGPGCDAGKQPPHKLLAWLSYWPKTSCGHPCQPAPYIPPLYTFFLKDCRPVPLPPPTHPHH